MTFLPVYFFVTALLYSAVGFGGGSTYTALLVLFDAPYQIIPIISLVCNIIVVSTGCYQFHQKGLSSLKKMLPVLATSMPFAFLGGYLKVSEALFLSILCVMLMLSGCKLLLLKDASLKYLRRFSTKKAYYPILGAVVGLFAGITGIGGGIFLSPFLYLSKWDNQKRIAAFCSFFIFVNSLSGLIGQLLKFFHNPIDLPLNIGVFLLLPPAVFGGGFIGTKLSLLKLSMNTLQKMTGLLMLVVSFRLLYILLQIPLKSTF